MSCLLDEFLRNVDGMQHISPPFFAQRETGRYDNMIAGMGKSVFDGNFNGNVLNFLKTLKTVFVDKTLRSPDQSHFTGHFNIGRHRQNRRAVSRVVKPEEV